MENLIEYWKNISEFIKNLTTSEITLISIFVTLLIYVLGKQNELKLKKHELRKDNYIKFIKTLEKVMQQTKEKNILKKTTNKKTPKNEIQETILQMPDEWFDMGSSLLLYGSKKLYKKYIFFRNFQSGLIKNSIYYKEDLSVYLVNDILNQIRKEVGLNFLEKNNWYDSSAFFINDMAYNPVIKQKWLKDRFDISMIKLELIMCDIINFIFIKKLYYYLIAPIIGIIKIIFKYFFLIPLGKIIINFFPKFAEKVKDEKINTK